MSTAMHHLFAPQNLSPRELEITEAGFAACDFPWGRLIPGLVAQVRRETIPIEWVDLSRWGQAQPLARAHRLGTWDEGHAIEVRHQVLGLAWYSGKVSLEKTLVNQPELAIEVLLSEGAHMVDFFYMSPEQREAIFNLYHDDQTMPHDHGWFEETGNNDYWSWVGESFMAGFCHAYTTIQPTLDSFVHPSTPEIGQQIRQILTPAEFFAIKQNSTILHRVGGWHEQQMRDVDELRYHLEAEASLTMFRRCKTCRWIV